MKSTHILIILSLIFPNFLCSSIYSYSAVIDTEAEQQCPPTEVWSITARECVPDDDDSEVYYEYVEESVENHCSGYNEVWDIVKKKCVQLFNDSSEEIRKTTTRFSSSGLTSSIVRHEHSTSSCDSLFKTSLSMSILFPMFSIIIVNL